MSTNYISSSVTSRGFDDAIYSPDTDAALDDRLEEARQNRTNYYRRMLASRNRPLDDYVISKRTTYHNSSSSPKEPSISDTVCATPIPKIPEPHSSWRFYTSYDNGEWKRHMVPVNKEEEEILREPTKHLRGERVRETTSPTAESSLNSLRRMRQAGGPLLACLQPRPKRSSESDAYDGHRAVEVHQTVRGGMMPVNGADPRAAQISQMAQTADWAKFFGNEEMAKRFADGEGIVLFEGEPGQGKTKQEITSKYTSTVTVTQPGGLQKSPGAVSPGGGDSGKVVEGQDGVRKSRRPRIYGFQEKVIIPTKYKNAINSEEQERVEANGVKTTPEKDVSKTGVIMENHGGLRRSEVNSGVRLIGPEMESIRRSTTDTAGRTPLSHSVKVVVVNSGSDAENDERAKFKSEQNEEEPGKSDTNAGKPADPFPMMPPAFKEMQENFQKQLMPMGWFGKEEDKGAATKDDQNPDQRVYTRDEQTFSEVGPDGMKRDGKVSQIYEVVTTTTTTGEASSIKDKAVSTKETATKETPTKEVPTKEVPIKEIPIKEIPTKERSSKAITIMEMPIMEIQTKEISSKVIPTQGMPIKEMPIVGHHDTHHSFSMTTPAIIASRTDDKKSSEMFDQTGGGLFKVITPRPRAEREAAFSGRPARQLSGNEDIIQKSTTRITTQPNNVQVHSGGMERSGNFGSGVTVRTHVGDGYGLDGSRGGEGSGYRSFFSTGDTVSASDHPGSRDSGVSGRNTRTVIVRESSGSVTKKESDRQRNPDAPEMDYELHVAVKN